MLRIATATAVKPSSTRATTYAITSLPRGQADANLLLSLLRGRWLIESRFHILDAHLREDHCRVRTGNAAHAFSSVRHLAINLAQKLKCSATSMCLEHAANVSVLCQSLHILKE